MNRRGEHVPHSTQGKTALRPGRPRFGRPGPGHRRMRSRIRDLGETINTDNTMGAHGESATFRTYSMRHHTSAGWSGYFGDSYLINNCIQEGANWTAINCNVLDVGSQPGVFISRPGAACPRPSSPASPTGVGGVEQNDNQPFGPSESCRAAIRRRRRRGARRRDRRRGAVGNPGLHPRGRGRARGKRGDSTVPGRRARLFPPGLVEDD